MATKYPALGKKKTPTNSAADVEVVRRRGTNGNDVFRSTFPRKKQKRRHFALA
jgi:hypothetical protein